MGWRFRSVNFVVREIVGGVMEIGCGMGWGGWDGDLVGRTWM